MWIRYITITLRNAALLMKLELSRLFNIHSVLNRCVLKILPLAPTLDQFDPLNTLASYLFKSINIPTHA